MHNQHTPQKHPADHLALTLLNAGYLDLNANWNWQNVYSPFARIYYVKEGHANTRIGHTVYPLKPHHMYLTPPFCLHDDECDGPFILFYIHFFEKAIHQTSIFDAYDFPVEVPASPLDLMLVEQLMQTNPDCYLKNIDPKSYDNPSTFSRCIADNSLMPLHSALETRGILCQLLSRFLATARPKAGNQDFRIKKTIRFIHENTDKAISVAQLAGIACMSECHFIRIFKKETHQTPVKYITLKKIEKAQFLLLTTGRSIRDIALELAFDNISYFNKIFKHHTGHTPGSYRGEYGPPPSADHPIAR
jgi:AraC-like DNA-binding protein